MPEDLSKKEVTIPVEDPNKPHAPQEQHGFFEKVKDKFSAHSAAPGPVKHGADVPQEGTKEERRAKAQELNK